MSTNGNESPPWGDREAIALRERNIRMISRIVVVAVVLIFLFVLLSVLKSIYTDWLWYGSLGFRGVFKTILGMRIWLFFSGTLLAAGLLAVNLYLAYRYSRGESILPVPPDVYRLGKLGIIAGAVLIALIMSIVFGFVAQGRWETFLIFFNRVSFGVEDPQFHKDVSFHVAVMPMLHFIQGWFMGIVIAILVAVSALYLAIFALRGIQITLTPKIRGHLAVLGAFLMVTIAAAHYLDIFELLFSGRGAAPGAGYTDINARLPVLWLLVAIALVAAVGFVVSNRYGGLRLMVASFSLWAVIAVLAGGIYPTGFQRLRVNPNEFEREEKFIGLAIEATRAGYNFSALDGQDLIEEQTFNYDPVLGPETLADNAETINNIRLWDDRPLRDVYGQKQAIRQYYDFVGVDVDRYTLPSGEYRQVMLAARELFPEDLEAEAQNWINRKLSFTHGYGLAMSPVNRITGDGLPEFFLADVPPQGVLQVTQPEVYYGENTKGFVIVNTNTEEFNYPGAEGPVYQDYAGTGGIGVGSFVRRVAYAWELVDFNLLISGQITSESRVQYRRQIHDRVSTIAPFLRLDDDPYLVLGDEGALWWIQDAYTVTDRYPYSAHFEEDFNYIRNSVKVVIDAYNGAVHFLVIEPDDPLIKIYRKAFPDLFKDFDRIDDLDPSLRAHIRYPIDLFNAQAEIYLRYHMRDPETFFKREDLWARAREVFATATNTQDVEPYYVIMKLPGEEKVEYVLLLPFTPGGQQRKVLVGWMAARNDGDNYGKLLTLNFPKDRPVDGPELIEGRITNDETIGAQLTLLCTGAKLCIRGNLLTIPMGNSLLYVEPLYIRAEALPFPELKKVIVADANKVVMGDSLEESLSLLLGEEVVVGPGTGAPDPGDTPAGGGLSLDDVEEELGIMGNELGQLQENLDALQKALERLNQALKEGGSEE